MFFILAVIIYAALGWAVYTRQAFVSSVSPAFFKQIENDMARTALALAALFVAALVLNYGAAFLSFIGKILIFSA
jgi:uncharacterized membrane protein required for colicin V production